MFCLDPGYILRPGYRGHWSLVDITYYIMLCQLCHIIKKYAIYFFLYSIYYIHIIFTAWLIFLVYTFENTNALEHIYIYLYVFCLVFFVLA